VEQPVVANSESLSVPVTIATDAPVGWRNVIVTSGNEIAEQEKGFKVNES